ncbi:hypothetical protein BRYFOR_09839 [Marvinbryantia formatexigens DSM 14469]|uniref:Uncharacterized protein n=1 Tax=Marvinbryantia formatexigens DSM 14469 TaxID=478749 RepID=C6LMD9_9FIRM|nr:hypothetical protein BRYFOR_09839 [Marvinbryantia formatexigens DSM 14469]
MITGYVRITSFMTGVRKAPFKRARWLLRQALIIIPFKARLLFFRAACPAPVSGRL